MKDFFFQLYAGDLRRIKARNGIYYYKYYDINVVVLTDIPYTYNEEYLCKYIQTGYIKILKIDLMPCLDI